MLPTKILKLRLLRIQKSQAHLSAQEKLMLVTMESPDLSANFLLRLFKVTLPKQWKFKHENEEDILYSAQLIQLIEEELLKAYETHARKYAWYEQCLMYKLNFIVPQPTPQQIKSYLRQLEPCLDQPPKIDLLDYFQQRYPSPQHAIALAQSYAGATEYTQAIAYYEWAAGQSTRLNEVAFYGYIDCLLKRNQPEYRPQLSDVEYAIDVLIRYQKPIDQSGYNKRLQQAISLLLPESILRTRAVNTHILADVGRGLNSLGKSFSGIFGGRESHLPFNQEVIASAPRLLTQHQVVTALLQSKAMRNSLALLLEPQFETAISSDSVLLKLLWQAIQQDPAVLALLQHPIQYDCLVNLRVSAPSHAQVSLDLGVIGFILEHGLMRYLDDIRVNKQHPERAELYAQRDLLLTEMIAFAKVFYRELLLPYSLQQSDHLQQVHLLLLKLAPTAFSSGLFAYQFEMQKRVHDLTNWMQLKLENGSAFEQMQAAWVALREYANFEVPFAQEKVQQLESQLERYRHIRLQQKQTDSSTPEAAQKAKDEPEI